MQRRTFIGITVAALAGLAVGVVARRPEERPRPGPRYLARHPSGVWGLSEHPGDEEGVLVRHPSGVLGIGPPQPTAYRLVMGDDGVVGVTREEAAG